MPTAQPARTNRSSALPAPPAGSPASPASLSSHQPPQALQSSLALPAKPWRRFSALLLPLLAAGLFLAAPAAEAHGGAGFAIGVEIGTPPPPLRYEAPPPPRGGYVWAPGYWAWDGYRYVWLEGRWLAQRPGYFYEPGRWEQRHEHWIYRGEAWRQDRAWEHRHHDRHEHGHGGYRR